METAEIEAEEQRANQYYLPFRISLCTYTRLVVSFAGLYMVYLYANSDMAGIVIIPITHHT